MLGIGLLLLGGVAAVLGLAARSPALIVSSSSSSSPVLASPPRAPRFTGKVLIHCTPNLSERRVVDPLEYFGISPSPHQHTPAGAMAFSFKSTLAKMLAAQTSCASLADHSMIWIPTPETAAGRPAKITSFGYYLINLGHDVRRAPPDGLRFLAGNPHCTSGLCPAIYECVKQDGQLFVSHTIPTRADGCGGGYQMSIFSPGQCWNGRSLGEGMGGSSPAAHIVGARRCRGVVIPEIMLDVSVGPDGLGGYLSSDVMMNTTKSSPGSTGHFDFVFGWGERRCAGEAAERDRPQVPGRDGFHGGDVSCVQIPGPQGATIYGTRPATGLAAAGACVTGPGCAAPVRRRRA